MVELFLGHHGVVRDVAQRKPECRGEVFGKVFKLSGQGVDSERHPQGGKLLDPDVLTPVDSIGGCCIHPLEQF